MHCAKITYSPAAVLLPLASQPSRICAAVAATTGCLSLAAGQWDGGLWEGYYGMIATAPATGVAVAPNMASLSAGNCCCY